MVERDCVLMVFSKAPVPGSVKTRLIPVLGEEGCTELYKSLLHRTLQTCQDAGFSNIQLWCFPDTSHPYFTTCSGLFGTSLQEQRGGDLGERMWFALSDALQQHPHGIIIGCDCPGLSPQDLIHAADMLEKGYDIVIGPSEDGGYYLLGGNVAECDLFRDINWGTSAVLSLTRDRIRELKLSCYELQEHWDIDKPKDLRRWETGYGK